MSNYKYQTSTELWFNKMLQLEESLKIMLQIRKL